MTDVFAVAINSFKFAKALVKGDAEGMKKAALAIGMDLGGDQILKAVNAVKAIASGDVMGGLRDLTQVALEVTPLGGSPIGIVLGGALELMDAYEQGGLKGLGQAALLMSPVGNVAEKGMAVQAGVEEGGAAGGTVAFLKTTSVGGRVDGMIEMGEAVAAGDTASAGGMAGRYAKGVVGDSTQRQQGIGSSLVSDPAGMAGGYVADSVMASTTVSRVETLSTTGPVGAVTDRVSNQVDATSTGVQTKLEGPSLTASAIETTAEIGTWQKINAPFARVISAATSLENKIDVMVDAPFLRVEGAISSVENRVVMAVERPELMLRTHVTGRVDKLVAKMDDKFVAAEIKVMKPVDGALARADQRVQDGVSTAMSPADKALSQAHDQVDDVFHKSWKPKPSPTSDASRSDGNNSEPRATRATPQSNSHQPEGENTTAGSAPPSGFKLNTASIEAMVASYRKNPPNLQWA